MTLAMMGSITMTMRIECAPKVMLTTEREFCNEYSLVCSRVI